MRSSASIRSASAVGLSQRMRLTRGAKLDRYVRNHTTKRFGPVREVEYGLGKGLVLEIAFERSSLASSSSVKP
jgi:hypothetical protein